MCDRSVFHQRYMGYHGRAPRVAQQSAVPSARAGHSKSSPPTYSITGRHSTASRPASATDAGRAAVSGRTQWANEGTMFHLSAYHLSGVGGAVVLTDMPAVPDPAVTIVNNHPIFPNAIQLQLGHAFGNADIVQVQVLTPKIRAIQPVNLRPFDGSALPQTRPPVSYWLRHPLSLNPIDENQMLVSAGGAATDYYGALWFSDGVMNAPPGDMYTARATATITGVTGQWATGAFILQTPLPAGMYSVIGLDGYATNCAYMRLVFPNQVWRPGIISGQTSPYINCPSFRFGQMGTFGTFSSYAQPNLDIFVVGACTSQVIDLDLVKVG